MKLKHKLFVIFATVMLLSVSSVFFGCSQEGETEFGEWTVVTAPTCEDAGMEMRTALSDTSIKETRAVPAIGHDWNAWETTTEPSCLLDGVETRTCNTCGNSDMRTITALGHKWKAWETVVAADCESSGTIKRVCERDDSHSEYQSVQQLGHDYTDWVITRAPTCTVGGVETRYCRNDNNHIEVRAIEPYGHDYGLFVTTVPATCTEPGESIRVCSHDSTHVIKSTLSARGHDYGDWVISEPATETESGVDIRVCRHDSTHTETRVSDPLGSDGLRYTLNSLGDAYTVSRNINLSGTVYIPATHNGLPVTELGSSAFMSCRNIERVVVLGNNLKTIGSSAFTYCDKLESVELPEGVEMIRAYAFNRCENLKSVSLPSTAKYLGLNSGYKGFYAGLIVQCPAIETITVADGNAFYKVDNGCLIESATGAVIAGTKSAVIPDYATSIAMNAFHGVSIESVRIPANVSSIGRAAFSNCKKLREVVFENGKLTSIDGDMGVIFGYCDSLERAVMSDNITYIGRFTFYDCPALREVVLGKNLQTIGSGTFRGCDAIEICEIPASVTSISVTAFSGGAISGLTLAAGNSVYVKDGNCLIERETDTVIAGGNDAVIPAYVKTIGDYAFYKRKLNRMVIPNGVQTVGDYAFAECASLESVDFQMNSQLDVVGSHAFENCTSLRSVLLPEKLRVISSSAFNGCNALSSVVFGFSDGRFTFGASSLESIGSYAFADTALKSFEIPATVTSIGKGAFRCEKLTSLTVESGNTAYTVTDGCLYEIETGTVLFAHDGATVPEGAKVIESDAFCYCKNARLEIPSSVVKICTFAFSGWTADQTIVIKGLASKDEADAVFGKGWDSYIKAVIVYEG